MYASNHFEEAIINLLRGTTVTAPANLYLGLYIGNPGDDGTGQEITYTNYARQQISFSAPVTSGNDVYIQNSSEIVFPECNTTAGTVQYLGVRDAASGGNLWLYAELSNTLVVEAGVTPIIRANSLKWTLQGNHSVFYKTKIQNILRNQNVSGFQPYLAFYKEADGGGIGDEFSGTDYARMRINFSEPTQLLTGEAQTQNTSNVYSEEAGDNWGRLAYYAIMDASSNGNIVFSKALDTSYNMTTGSVAGFKAGDLKFSVK